MTTVDLVTNQDTKVSEHKLLNLVLTTPTATEQRITQDNSELTKKEREIRMTKKKTKRKHKK